MQWFHTTPWCPTVKCVEVERAGKCLSVRWTLLITSAQTFCTILHLGVKLLNDSHHLNMNSIRHLWSSSFFDKWSFLTYKPFNKNGKQTFKDFLIRVDRKSIILKLILKFRSFILKIRHVVPVYQKICIYTEIICYMSFIRLLKRYEILLSK